MKFSGIQKTSLVDYPSRVAAVLFTPGCNLRCPFCHNWRIVVDPKPPFLNEETALEILKSRRKFVDAVVVTGGEPAMHRDLPKFLKRLRKEGFSVKLDTNGFYPGVLEECLAFVDYVSMDVKTSLEKYPLLGAGDVAPFQKTIRLLKEGRVPYEFRTTVVPSFVDADDIPKLGELVKDAADFAFQQFVPNDTLEKSYASRTPYSAEVIAGFADTMRKYVNSVTLRV